MFFLVLFTGMYLATDSKIIVEPGPTISLASLCNLCLWESLFTLFKLSSLWYVSCLAPCHVVPVEKVTNRPACHCTAWAGHRLREPLYTTMSAGEENVHRPAHCHTTWPGYKHLEAHYPPLHVMLTEEVTQTPAKLVAHLQQELLQCTSL